MLVWLHVDMLVCWCAGVLVYWCAGVLVYWCTGVLVCWCAGVLVCWCAGVLVYWCTGVPVCLCAYVLGLMYKAFLCMFVMYRKEHSWLQDKAVKSGPPPSEYVKVPVFIPFQF